MDPSFSLSHSSGIFIFHSLPLYLDACRRSLSRILRFFLSTHISLFIVFYLLISMLFADPYHWSFSIFFLHQGYDLYLSFPTSLSRCLPLILGMKNPLFSLPRFSDIFIFHSLHSACKKGYEIVATLLLDREADINAKDNVSPDAAPYFSNMQLIFFFPI